jgi:hypothetical protein
LWWRPASVKESRTVNVMSRMETGDPAYRRKYPAPQVVDYDALLTAVGARGDGDAFTRLFDHFGPRVQSQLLRLGVAPFAAEDVTQDVMETIWRKAHLYDPGKAAAATWDLSGRAQPPHRCAAAMPRVRRRRRAFFRHSRHLRGER